MDVQSDLVLFTGFKWYTYDSVTETSLKAGKTLRMTIDQVFEKTCN